MTGGGGGRRSPPELLGGGARPSAVGRFGDVKGLVDCCSPDASRGRAEIGGGMEVDGFVPCCDDMEEEDGRFCSSDSEELEGSLVAEFDGAASEVCMELEESMHGAAHVGHHVGAEVLLQEALLVGVGELKQGSPFLHKSVPAVGLESRLCQEDFGALRDGGSPHGMGVGEAGGSVPSGLPSAETCKQGVREVVSVKVTSQGGGGSAQIISASSSRPARAAWNRPAVIPLPVVVPSSEVRDGVDRVRLELDEVDATVRLLEFALVGRMFGRRIPFAFLNAELHHRWQRFGPFRLITVSGDCFICIFDALESRDVVLMGGPWIVAGQVLGIDCWSPGFSPSSKVGSVTPVWVRLPGLPMYCWGGRVWLGLLVAWGSRFGWMRRRT